MILAIETSVKQGSIAILDNCKVICSRKFVDEKSISSELIKQIDILLAEFDLKKENLTCIGVSNGPGSLTGIRVGISVAMGLAASINVDCFGVSLLDAIRLERFENSSISLIAANNSQSYWQEINKNGTLITSVNLINNEKINDLLNQSSTTFIIENILFEKLVKQNIFDEGLVGKKIIFCPENLAVLVGKKVLEEIHSGQARIPQPLYLQGNAFKTISFTDASDNN